MTAPYVLEIEDGQLVMRDPKEGMHDNPADYLRQWQEVKKAHDGTAVCIITRADLQEIYHRSSLMGCA